MDLNRLIVHKPFRMMEFRHSRSQYYEDFVLAQERGYRTNAPEYTVSEGHDNVYDGDWDFDDSQIYERRVHGGETMFVVFDYETKQLIKASNSDDVMFYSSLKDAYEDQEDLIGSDDEFNSRLCIFEVPDLKKDEVKPGVSDKVKTFAASLKKTASNNNWHTNK